MKTKFNRDTFRITEAGNLGKFALIAGVAGLAISATGYFTDSKQFFYSYLTAFAFWATIGLGGLFFTMLHHLTSATWSVVLRRMTETVMATLPILIILFLPVVFGMHDLYHWTHKDVVEHDAVLKSKEAYLNMPFFFIRTALYFVVWVLLSRTLYSSSLNEDQASSPDLTMKMKRVSAPGMVLFGLTLTFASFDWLMSLDPHWYSTIFGVYVFSGTVLAILSFITLLALYLRNQEILEDVITVEHYHDLGKLLFAFTVFWAYIAFSQFMLIWYANIPEETLFFDHRWHGTWKIVSMIILFGHFVVPFVVLLTRAAKRNLFILKMMGIWLLLMHWVDIYWLVMPNLHKEGAVVSWMDLTTMIGVGGLFIWLFWNRFVSQPIVPVKDPKFAASVQFENI